MKAYKPVLAAALVSVVWAAALAWVAVAPVSVVWVVAALAWAVWVAVALAWVVAAPVWAVLPVPAPGVAWVAVVLV